MSYQSNYKCIACESKFGVDKKSENLAASIAAFKGIRCPVCGSRKIKELEYKTGAKPLEEVGLEGLREIGKALLEE